MLAVSGPLARAVGNTIGAGHTAMMVWNIVRRPVILVLVVLSVAILYYVTPNVRQPKFRWIIASVLFGVYVGNFGKRNKTYGTLAGVIVYLLWVWITNVSLLFGAELDAELERGRQLQAGLPAEHAVRLPPRDTRGIEKTKAKDER